MRVIQIDNYGPPEILHVAERPDPIPGLGEIRVRATAIGVNPADFKWRSGMIDAIVPLRFPHVIGYDVAGVVDRQGQDVAGPALGTRVFGMLSHIGQGAYAEYAIFAAEQLVPIPDGVSAEIAAALPTAGLTGVQMVDVAVCPAAGDVVLITGMLGAVGRFACYAARARGVRVVAAVRESQIAQAVALGAEAAFVLEAGWGGVPFDHVLDTVGGLDVAALCRHVRPGGRICTVSTTPIPPEGLPAAPFFYAVQHDPAGLAALAGAVASGRLVVPISETLPLDRAAEAHRRIEAGGAGGKIILLP